MARTFALIATLILPAADDFHQALQLDWARQAIERTIEKALKEPYPAPVTQKQ